MYPTQVVFILNKVICQSFEKAVLVPSACILYYITIAPAKNDIDPYLQRYSYYMKPLITTDVPSTY